jgi:alpha-mannosidase
MSTQGPRRDLGAITVHMIGNAHIDPVWQWRWEEGRQEVLDTCRAALDRIRETPGFIFCRSSAVTYQWIEETDPELFAEIKRQVARGHWCIVNGWWEQPDCNIPSGESLVRHGLYGQRYFLSRFGKMARTGWNVDTFGHCGMLPQILKGQGMDRYCFFRPDPREMELPGPLFWWQAPDGSRVLAGRMPGHYCTWADALVDHIRRAAEATPRGLQDMMCFYGVGNHGGGPTKDNIRSIEAVNADPQMPAAVFSTPDAFFDQIEPQSSRLPVVDQELQYHSRGCYTAVSAIKAHNRRAECALLAAEKLACLAEHLTALAYPAADLEEAWKLVLFNQFHDVMAGTSIRPACDDAVTDYEMAQALAARAIRKSMTRVSAGVDTSGPGRPVVVYNTLSWQRLEVVEAEITWPNQDECVHVVDETGAQVPSQIVHSNISGRGATIKIAFEADVPPCGYRTYRVLQGPGAPQPTPFCAGPTSIQSPLYRLEFDAESGYLTRLRVLSAGAEMLGGPAGVPVVMADRSDTWSHGVAAFRDEIGRFRADTPPQLVEVGPARAVVRIPMSYGESRVTLEYTLYARAPRIDLHVGVDYHGRHEFLKLSFPTALGGVTATYETAYGNTVRPANGEEQPAQMWADVSGTLPDGSPGGLAVLNDSRYGYDALDGELRLSVLRTPIYCFHDPAKVDPRRRYEYTDQGPCELRVALLPHGGDWRAARVVREGRQLNAPCLLREEPAHPGRLAPCFSFASVDCSHCVLEVVKRKEDGQGLALRLVETDGQAANTTLHVAGGDFALSLRPYEIKTVIVADGKLTEADLLERPLP